MQCPIQFFQHHYKVGSFVISILQVRKPSLREDKELTQSQADIHWLGPRSDHILTQLQNPCFQSLPLCEPRKPWVAEGLEE